VVETLNASLPKIGSIMDLKVVPYGNARIDLDAKKVTCQHGALECQANLYEMCGIHLNPNRDEWFPYYACLESKGSGEGGGGAAVLAAVDDCAAAAGIDAQAIHDCFNDDDLSWQLQVDAANVTAATNHKYTPWVEVPTGTVLSNSDTLVKAVCKAYSGHPKPASCPKLDDEEGRCYKDF